MDIIFIDPGYGKGFSVPSGGSLTSVESEEYNPINGVAFTGDDCVVGLTLPDSFGDTSKRKKLFSCRFSVYLDLTSEGYFAVGVGNTNLSNSFQISSSVFTYRYKSATSSQQQAAPGGTTQGFHNIVFSIGSYGKVTPPSTSVFIYGLMYTDFDGETKNIDWSDSTAPSGLTSTFGSSPQIYFTFPSSETNKCYISNVIVATAIDSNDPLLTSDSLLVPLTLSKPTGDFSSVGGGEYVGNASGQKLLQTIDTTAAVAKFGDTSKVSHLVVYGNPGYRVGSNITEAYGISKDGNSSITAHGSCELSTDTDATAIVAWETPDTKLPDLDGLKVGWQI